MWPIKLIFIALFIYILVSLFQALKVMRNTDNKMPMSTFIGRRLLFSVLLLGLIILAIVFGLITPNPRPY